MLVAAITLFVTIDENYDDEPLYNIVDTPDVPCASGKVDWVPSGEGTVPANAVLGGFDNENLYVGRARHEGAVIPGKVVSSHGVCYVAWGGEEHAKQEYEVKYLLLTLLTQYVMTESIPKSYCKRYYLNMKCLLLCQIDNSIFSKMTAFLRMVREI